MEKSLAEQLREVSNGNAQTFEKDIKDIVAKCRQAAEEGQYEIIVTVFEMSHGEYEQYKKSLNDMGLSIQIYNSANSFRPFNVPVVPINFDYVVSWK